MSDKHATCVSRSAYDETARSLLEARSRARMLAEERDAIAARLRCADILLHMWSGNYEIAAGCVCDRCKAQVLTEAYFDGHDAGQSTTQEAAMPPAGGEPAQSSDEAREERARQEVWVAENAADHLPERAFIDRSGARDYCDPGGHHEDVVRYIPASVAEKAEQRAEELEKALRNLCREYPSFVDGMAPSDRARLSALLAAKEPTPARTCFPEGPPLHARCNVHHGKIGDGPLCSVMTAQPEPQAKCQCGHALTEHRRPDGQCMTPLRVEFTAEGNSYDVYCSCSGRAEVK